MNKMLVYLKVGSPHDLGFLVVSNRLLHCEPHIVILQIFETTDQGLLRKVKVHFLFYLYSQVINAGIRSSFQHFSNHLVEHFSLLIGVFMFISAMRFAGVQEMRYFVPNHGWVQIKTHRQFLYDFFLSFAAAKGRLAVLHLLVELTH